LALDCDGPVPNTLGLELFEGKDLLAAGGRHLVETEVNATIAKQASGPQGGRARQHKDICTIVVHSLFGALRLANPPLVALLLTRLARPDVPTWLTCYRVDRPGAAYPLLPDFRFEHDDAAAGEYVTALDERRHPRRDGFIGIVSLACQSLAPGPVVGLGSAAAPLPLLGACAPAVRVGLPSHNRGRSAWQNAPSSSCCRRA
jgi:hypothetical protein